MLAGIAACISAAPPSTQASRFLRFVADEHAPGGTLQAAIVSYRNAAGAAVDLVSAVHVAEGRYFADLQERFKGYDAVLYELIKPPAAGPPPPGVRGAGAVGAMQRFMKQALELEFQLDAIDYTPDNFIHADLDARQFAKFQAERGESLPGLMLQAALRQMMRGGNANALPGDLMLGQLLFALQSPDRARQLKLMLAPQFEEMDRMAEDIDGPDGSVLLAERNKKAIEVLRRVLAGKRRNIAIFYGAAHMPDMEKRLLELGFRPTAQEWLLAWDMTAPPATQPEQP